MSKTSQLGALQLELAAGVFLAGAGSTAGRSRLQLAASRERRSAKRPERELGQRWAAAAEALSRGGGSDSSRPPTGLRKLLRKLQAAAAAPRQGRAARGKVGSRRRIGAESVAARL
jgi:hypothetical protein